MARSLLSKPGVAVMPRPLMLMTCSNPHYSLRGTGPVGIPRDRYSCQRAAGRARALPGNSLRAMSSATLMPKRVLMGTATSARLKVSDSCGHNDKARRRTQRDSGDSHSSKPCRCMVRSKHTGRTDVRVTQHDKHTSACRQIITPCPGLQTSTCACCPTCTGADANVT